MTGKREGLLAAKVTPHTVETKGPGLGRQLHHSVLPDLGKPGWAGGDGSNSQRSEAPGELGHGVYNPRPGHWGLAWRRWGLQGWAQGLSPPCRGGLAGHIQPSVGPARPLAATSPSRGGSSWEGSRKRLPRASPTGRAPEGAGPQGLHRAPPGAMPFGNLCFLSLRLWAPGTEGQSSTGLGAGCSTNPPPEDTSRQGVTTSGPNR